MINTKMTRQQFQESTKKSMTNKKKPNERYIKCINNKGEKKFIVLQNFTAIGIPIEYQEILPITIGKIYKIQDNSYYYNKTIINDLNQTKSYSPDRFIDTSLEEWRNYQLSKILNQNE